MFFGSKCRCSWEEARRAAARWKMICSINFLLLTFSFVIIPIFILCHPFSLSKFFCVLPFFKTSQECETALTSHYQTFSFCFFSFFPLSFRFLVSLSRHHADQMSETDLDQSLDLEKFLKRNYSWFSLSSWRSEFSCLVLLSICKI